MELNALTGQRLAVDFLMVADRAEAINGKLYLFGGAWDRQFVPDFAKPILLSFAVGILVPWNETNRDHHLVMTIVGADGQPVEFKLDATFKVGRPVELQEGEAQRTILALPGTEVRFPGPGKYAIRAHIDTEFAKETSFHLVRR